MARNRGAQQGQLVKYQMIELKRFVVLWTILSIEMMAILLMLASHQPATMGALTLSKTVQAEQPNVPATVAPTTEPVTNTPTEPQTEAVTEGVFPAEDVPPAPTVAPTPTPTPSNFDNEIIATSSGHKGHLGE